MRVPSSSKQSPLRILGASLLLPALACAVAFMPSAARADSGSVECMLPGAIHNVGGHPTMGARHAVQTSPEDCQQRGGEYTVPTENASPVAPDASAVDTTPVRCLLPRQTRQLGSKARYTTKSRIVHTTASDCQNRQGKVLASHGKSRT